MYYGISTVIVSTHSRPKAAAFFPFSKLLTNSFNTQPPEGGCRLYKPTTPYIIVSTHSRPKAAVSYKLWFFFHKESFNTQPPEGGC